MNKINSRTAGEGKVSLNAPKAASTAVTAEDQLHIRYINPRILILAQGLPQETTTSRAMLLPMNAKFRNKSQRTRYLEEVGSYMRSKHPERFMVWNLADVSYDTAPFDEQVIQFSFPGMPTPPLETLHQICKSIESWLAAESRNVALIHCNTGKGRTSMTLAAYLFYTKQHATTLSALSALNDSKTTATAANASPASVIVPTQHRYLEYFERYVRKGSSVSSRPLGITRIQCFGIPAYKAAPGDSKSCRPYLQIFQKEKLVRTTVGGVQEGDSDRYDDEDTELSSRDLMVYSASKHEKMVFNVQQVVDGDTIIRMRHFHSIKKRVTMLRYGFHTAMLDLESSSSSSSSSQYILHLERSDLDIAYKSSRFGEDFRVEVHFGEVKQRAKKERVTKRGGKIEQQQQQQQPSSEEKTPRGKKDVSRTNVEAAQVKVVSPHISADKSGDEDGEEDITDLEARLHQVLEDIDSSDGEETDVAAIKLRHESKLSVKPPGSLNSRVLVNETEDDEDDDGDQLLAALHAELANSD